MSLRIRRGTESQRTGVTFNSGEIVWTTDLQQLWVGDGVTQGGKPVVGPNITGYGLTYNNTTHTIGVAGLTTDDITQALGANNRWFTSQLARDAVAPMFTGGSHDHISFQYDAGSGKINATVTLDGVGIATVEDDPAPSLGGDLTLNSFDITGTGNIDITGDISATGDISSSSITADTAVIPSASITNLTSDTIHAPDDGQGIEMVSKIGNSFAIGYYNGTYASKTAVAKNTGGMVMSIKGWTGAGYVFASGIGAQWDSDAVLTDSAPKSGAAIFSGAGGDAINLATLNSSGVWSAPALAAGDGTAAEPSIRFTTDGSQDSGLFHPGDGIVCVAINATERARFDSGGLRVGGFIKVEQISGGVLPSPAEAGMIVLDGSTFKGYNGTSWVALS